MAAAPEKVDRPERWTTPFSSDGGEPVSEAMIEWLRNYALRSLFQDENRFPRQIPLVGILKNDCRVKQFAAREVIVNQGDYGNSAFVILGGGVQVILKPLPNEVTGLSPRKTLGYLSALARLWQKDFREPEVRGPKNLPDSESGAQDSVRSVLDFPEFLTSDPAAVKEVQSQVGEVFGEIAALGRTPRTATVVSGEEGAQLLEIRWQGLREIRNASPGWKQMIDERFRKNSLQTFLAEAPYVSNLWQEHVNAIKTDDSAITDFHILARNAEFHSYGRFEWYGSYKALAGSSGADYMAREPLIAEQGSYPNHLHLIRSGFARVSRKYNHGEQTVSYLGKGKVFGLAEMYYNWNNRAADPMPYQHHLRALGYVDVVAIPTQFVEAFVLPNLTAKDEEALNREIEHMQARGEAVYDKAIDRLRKPRSHNGGLDANVLEFLVQHRAINGTAAMLIDLNRCTRCDDCVRACAETHGDNPRFLRYGPNESGIQLTHACMHCVDPVCLIGCPTGAIYRASEGGQVTINDATCIGCATCAESCPYNNIQMVEIRNEEGDLQPGTDNSSRAFPEEDWIRKATKCDLCIDYPAGPSCERACPHDALARIDMSDQAGLAKWLNYKELA